MLAPGTRIGGLLIGDMLGRGAMGEVYRGVQLSLRRPVAVKRIAGHLLDDEGAVQRFAREAQCVARVQSPHVVTVYEFGRYPAPDGDEHLLLVMELVDGGRSLGELIDGPLPWRLVCGAIQQVVEGLCAAAEHGVVHRDIKPDNIMLAPKGVAKLCDFGLARSVDSTAMTAAGSLLGTPNYMPPEACRGDEVDHAGDIYALGGTWFHLLAGRPPFGGGSTMALLRAHIEDPAPDLHAIDPGIPQAVARLVAQCLGKDPVFRPTAAQLRDELHAASREGLHLPRLVPELLGDAAGAERDPSTTMTVIAQDPTLSLILAEDYDPEAETLPTGRAARAARGAGRRTRTVAVLLPLLVAAGAGGLWWWSQGASPERNDHPGGELIAMDPADRPTRAGPAMLEPAAGTREQEAVSRLDAATTTTAVDDGPDAASRQPEGTPTPGPAEVDRPVEPAEAGEGEPAAEPSPAGSAVEEGAPAVASPVSTDRPVDPEPASAAVPAAQQAAADPSDAVPGPDDGPAPAGAAEAPVQEDATLADDAEAPAAGSDGGDAVRTDAEAQAADTPAQADHRAAETAVPTGDPAPAEAPPDRIDAGLVAAIESALEQRRWARAGELLADAPAHPELAPLRTRQQALTAERDALIAALGTARDRRHYGSIEQRLADLSSFPEDAELVSRIRTALAVQQEAHLARLEAIQEQAASGDLQAALGDFQALPAEPEAHTEAVAERMRAVEEDLATRLDAALDAALLRFEAALVQQDHAAARDILRTQLPAARAIGREAELDAAVRRLGAAVGQQ